MADEKKHVTRCSVCRDEIPDARDTGARCGNDHHLCAFQPAVGKKGMVGYKEEEEGCTAAWLRATVFPALLHPLEAHNPLPHMQGGCYAKHG